MTNKITLTILLFLAFSLSIFAQSETKQMVKVPKQYSFEFGNRYMFSTKRLDANVQHGFGMLFDYAWKLSGLNGSRPAVYLSVPLGYTHMFAADDSTKGMGMLCYGWTVRHELTKNKKVTPYVGYGLMLNKIRIYEIEGSVMGHQTQFEAGVNYKPGKRLNYFAKIQYSYSSFPQLGNPKKIVTHFGDFRIGLRF
jgi:hypothetical protein